jgi:hypothetical protein
MKQVSDVIYVPQLSTNLLSVSRMVEKGLVVTFSTGECKIYHQNDYSIHGDAKATATNVGGIYKLDV